jgi:hypothetical protein
MMSSGKKFNVHKALQIFTGISGRNWDSNFTMSFSCVAFTAQGMKRNRCKLSHTGLLFVWCDVRQEFTHQHQLSKNMITRIMKRMINHETPCKSYQPNGI